MTDNFRQLSQTLWFRGSAQPPICRRLILLDLDYTLVSTASGSVLPRRANDWIWLDATIPKQLVSISTDARLVVITNQLRAQPYILDRISKIAETLAIGWSFYVSTGNDIWRKPNTGIYERYLDADCFRQIIVVGDAAGRPNDHSDSDRAFAYNIGLFLQYPARDMAQVSLTFSTPEEFFGLPTSSAEQRRHWLAINPARLLRIAPTTEPPLPGSLRVGKWQVIMIGPPASGKTFIATRLFPSAKTAPSTARLVISDDQHATKKERYHLAKAAKSANRRVLYVWMNDPRASEIYSHLAQYQIRNAWDRDLSVTSVISSAKYWRTFEDPRNDNFDPFPTIYQCPFVPHFDTACERLRWLQR